MTNKLVLIHKSNKNHFIIYVLFHIFILNLILLTFFVDTYDSIKVTGIIKCEEECQITLNLPYNKIDIFQDDSKITYLNKDYKIMNITYDEPYLEKEIPYQNVIIKTDLASDDKIINFSILYNKQRIIKKIKNILLEGEE